ncbi:MAG: lysophospholipase [Thiogranum sp.]|nr:lysophospholipase [Thiogranum sp.]
MDRHFVERLVATARLLPLVLLASCARPYIVPAGTAGITPALNAGYAVMEDGYRLPVTRWGEAGNCRALVIALHGLNDYRKAFSTTGEFLARHGINVLAYDQRGFGAAPGWGYWHGSERLIRDLRTMISLVSIQYPDCPLYVLGESMGGAVALAALGEPSPQVAGMVLVAPAVWSRDSMPLYQRAALWLAVHTVPDQRLTGKGLKLKPSDNIDMLRALGRDPLVIKATRVDVLYGVGNLMDRAARAPLDGIGRTLILYGRRDEIIPAQPTCRLVRRLPNGPDRRWRAILYDNGFHMLTRDLQAETVLGDIAHWLLASGDAAHELSDSLVSYCAESD